MVALCLQMINCNILVCYAPPDPLKWPTVVYDTSVNSIQLGAVHLSHDTKLTPSRPPPPCDTE